MKKLVGAALALAVLALLIPFALSSCRDARLRSNHRAVYDALCALHNARFEAFQGAVPPPAAWNDAAASLIRLARLPGVAEADATSGRAATPFHGHFFRALDPNDPETSEHDRDPFAIFAIPEAYGRTGTWTYFINGAGILQKDTGGVCPDRPVTRRVPGHGWGIID